MRYLSLFSGIEAATVAWDSLGWEPVAFAEFDKFPKAVLAHHYPDVPDLGDVTKITDEQIKSLGHIDIVVGGSPCQDLSIAGKRAGLRNEDGSVTRSGLFDEQMRIFETARRYNGARYCLWENVPGAFSSNNGNDFAYVLGSMVSGSVSVPFDGWKNSGIAVSGDGRRIVEWRVLDAQYFGVPQRRRRIFALLDVGEWWSRQPILFEQEGVRGNSAESRSKREGVAGGAEEGAGRRCAIPINTMNCQGRPSDDGRLGSGIGRDGDPLPTISTVHQHAVCTEGKVMSIAVRSLAQTIKDDMASTLCSTDYKEPQVVCIQGSMIGREEKNGPRGDGINIDKTFTLNATDRHAVAVRTAQTGANGIGVADEKAHTLDGANGQAVAVLPFDTTQVTSKQNGSNPHYGDPCHPLAAKAHPPAVVYENHGADGRVKRCEDGNVPTLTSGMGTGGNNVPLVMATGQANAEIGGGDLSNTDGRTRPTNPRIASGIEVFPTLLANVGEKQWIGNQEALSGNYHILEDK